MLATEAAFAGMERASHQDCDAWCLHQDRSEVLCLDGARAAAAPAIVNDRDPAERKSNTPGGSGARRAATGRGSFGPYPLVVLTSPPVAAVTEQLLP